MTFDVEVAGGSIMNDAVMESRMNLDSESGALDSRRSLSEI